MPNPNKQPLSHEVNNLRMPVFLAMFCAVAIAIIALGTAHEERAQTKQECEECQQRLQTIEQRIDATRDEIDLETKATDVAATDHE